MCDKPNMFEVQTRQLDFASVKAACPKGIYLAPTPRNANVWHGVLFVRKGPYAPAILKFQVHRSLANKPPTVIFATDIFHPLVSPLTTYTYTTGDTGSDTVSATDEERLPPGGFSLRHAFPQWYSRSKFKEVDPIPDAQPREATDGDTAAVSIVEKPSVCCGPVQIVQVLHYMRSAFDTEQVLDKIPLEAAGNPGAWHAWHTHRGRATGVQSTDTGANVATSSSTGTRQQPGGARRPGQWNWDGVWEERVRRGVQASISQHALYGASGPGDELITFLDIDPQILEQAITWSRSTDSANESITA